MERDSGKEDRVEQVLPLGRELVVELVMKGGEVPSRVEEDRGVVTGEDQLQGVGIREDRVVRVGARDSNRAT